MSIRNQTVFRDDVQTHLYAKHRPTYPEELFQKIESFCKESHCGFDVAVDVGCGSGQGTLPLLKFFKKVMGVDASEQQISKAPQAPNVTYHVSKAEDLSFIETSSVDLVSVAQAFHWFSDEDKFFQEADRILKPGGSLILYGFGFCNIDHAEADAYLQKLMNEVLVNYMDEKPWRMMNDRFASVSLPYRGWVRDDSLSMRMTWNIDEFIGYLGSMIPFSQYRKVHPTDDLLGKVKDRLKSLFFESGFGEDHRFQVTWPTFLLMGHKPVS